MSSGDYRVKGKTFYVTGRFNGFTQDYIRSLIWQAGGIVRSSPSKRTQIGVVGSGSDPDEQIPVNYNDRVWSLEMLFNAIKHDASLKDSK